MEAENSYSTNLLNNLGAVGCSSAEKHISSNKIGQNTTTRLDDIDTKLERVDVRLDVAEEKIDTKCNELEKALNEKISEKEFKKLELQFQQPMEFSYQEKSIKEIYAKKLNLLMHGLEEDKGSVWKNKEKTTHIFQKFLSGGLKLERDSINLVDNHR